MICTWCKYWNVCGGEDRTEKCEGKRPTFQYLRFQHEVMTAYDLYDNEWLAELKEREPEWFKEIIEDLEREDGLR